MSISLSKLPLMAWSVTSGACLLALIVWWQGLNNGLASINSYTLFPLLGILAFSIMWAHYIMSAVRQIMRAETEVLKTYFEITSWLALIALLLHPGLLVWQLWRDGFGLPPGSVLESYVAPTLRGVVILGTLSLAAFLLYELRRIFQTIGWWRWIQYLSDGAMLAVLYHGWQLGRHLQSGWYRMVWIMYAITLIAALGYRYRGLVKEKRESTRNDKTDDLTHNRQRRQG
ncbi:MAG: hypothetical protein WD467_02985 [Candidatus Saccharimonadales bacterium]